MVLTTISVADTIQTYYPTTSLVKITLQLYLNTWRIGENRRCAKGA